MNFSRWPNISLQRTATRRLAAAELRSFASRAKCPREGWLVLIASLVLFVAPPSQGWNDKDLAGLVVHVVDLRQDGQFNQATPGAVIRLNGPAGSQAAAADAGGNHEFNGLPSGAYRIVVTLDGFEPSVLTVLIHGSGCEDVEIPLTIAPVGAVTTWIGDPLI